MVRRDELLKYTNELLQIERFRDYAPNGLQVEGCDEIRVLASAVTASYAAVEAAAAMGAHSLLVHHGYFWRGEEPAVIGMRRRRLALLLANDINLLAYHLPLDAHADYGNNVQLARILSIQIKGSFGPEPGLALHGELDAPLTGVEFARHVGRCLGREPLHVAKNAGGPIRRIGWCTGAAQNYIEAAAQLGLDAYLSGEVSEQTFHTAQETGVQFFCAGHHATERYGVMALGEYLASKFGLDHQFVEIPNPI
jgi:dinuclear metal center YbgI/SA1388 family protein